jgi:hypothetical protein
MTTFAAYPNDDAYWDGTTLYNGGTSFVAGYQSGVAYGMVLIWDATGIPQGVTINSAAMEYTKTTGSGTPDIRIHFEDADNPSFPASRADAVGRSVTASYGNITSLPSNARHSTPDLSASLQTVVDRGGFAEDAIQLFWLDNKGTGTGWIQGRLIEQTGTTNDPYLSVDYSEAAAGGGHLLLLGVG